MLLMGKCTVNGNFQYSYISLPEGVVFFSPLKLYLIIEFVPEDHELSDECWLPVKMEEPGVSKEDISRFSGIWRPFFSVC